MTTKSSLVKRKNIPGQSRNYKEIEFKSEPRIYPSTDRKINFLHKFVLENIAKIEANKRNLFAGERAFMESIKNVKVEDMQQWQRNQLHSISQRFK